MRTKTQSTWHLLYEQWLCKYYKAYEDYIKLATERPENTKSAERYKTSFPKETIENVDLYKPVLNKIMTIHE